MSTALINRSLTTIRTELEFLRDSEVITEGLYNKLVNSLPDRFQKDSQPWDVDKLGTTTTSKDTTSGITESLAKTNISSPPAYAPPISTKPRPVGYCIAVYDYRAQESDDISLVFGDKIAVVEHLSEDWWKGYKQGTEKTGVFPSNYVKPISESEFNNINEKSQYQAVPNPQPQPQPQQGPSYGGYAQFPPPSTNYYPPQQYTPPPQQQYVAPPPQQPQQVAVEQPQQHHSTGGEHAKKFGKKLGNAAIFGAGATIGSNIVNSIF